QSQRENPQRSVVGVLKRLGPALDRAVAQDEPVDIVSLTQEPDELLLSQLAQAVSTRWPHHALVGDHWRGRALAHRAGRVPGPPLQRLRPARLRVDVAVLGTAVLPLAVDWGRQVIQDADLMTLR